MKSSTILKKLKDAFQKFDPGVEIILFGSRARGDYNKESDWDILVLTSLKLTKKLKNDIRDAAFDIEIDTEEPISILIYSKEEWESFEITPLYQNVKSEGVRL